MHAIAKRSVEFGRSGSAHAFTFGRGSAQVDIEILRFSRRDPIHSK
jgi:hypothetical protein